MLKRCCLALVGFLLVSSPIVVAQRKPGNFSTYGVGSKSCGKWVAESSNVEFINSAWVHGFISGIGYSDVLGDLKATDSDAVKVWMDNYCRANPLKAVVDASIALVFELAAAK